MDARRQFGKGRDARAGESSIYVGRHNVDDTVSKAYQAVFVFIAGRRRPLYSGLASNMQAGLDGGLGQIAAAALAATESQRAASAVCQVLVFRARVPESSNSDVQIR